MPAFYETASNVRMLSEMARAEFADAQRCKADARAHVAYARMFRAAGLEVMAKGRERSASVAGGEAETHDNRCVLLCQSLRNLGQTIRLA